jgi:putative peptide zinc metalloprotease protein
VAGCRRIAVVSRKGGGKTTTTLMLGHTFASLRGDRVIALDGNPDAGSLAYRVRRETSNTITGLLAHRNAINRYADIRAYTSQAPTRRSGRSRRRSADHRRASPRSSRNR